MYKMSLDSNLTAIKYDPELFTRSVNEMIVLNKLPFSFVESEGFRRFYFNVVHVYKHISQGHPLRK